MGGMGLIFTPVLVRHLLGSLGLSGPMTSTFWTPNSPIGRYNLPLATHLPPPPTLPARPTFICAIHYITTVVKKVLKLHHC